MKYESATLLTKSAMANALKELIREKAYEKISVNDIVMKCGLNRKTFYYHFKDKDDLFVWCIEHEITPKLQEFNLITDFADFIKFIMNFLEEDMDFIVKASQYIGLEKLKQLFLGDLINGIYSLVLLPVKEKYKLDDGYMNFLSRFFANAILDMAVYSIQTTSEEDREKILPYYQFTLESSIDGILKNVKKEK